MKAYLPLAAAAALLAGCATTAPVLTQWNPPPVGARWEIAQKNTGSYGRDTQFQMTRVADMSWQGKPAVALRNSAGGVVLSDPATGHWHALVGPDGRPAATFEPPIGWPYPIKVGNETTRRHRVSMGQAAPMEFDFTCKVEAYEKVTVRAGTFDAYRVHCRTSGGADEMYWSSPATGLFVKTRLVRPASDPRGAGTQEAELVVAPAAR